MGLVWQIWHIIPDLQLHHTSTWMFWHTLQGVALRILMVWIYNNTGRSVFSSVLLHALDNLCWSLFPNFGSGFDPRFGAMFGFDWCSNPRLAWRKPRGNGNAADRDRPRRSPNAGGGHSRLKPLQPPVLAKRERQAKRINFSSAAMLAVKSTQMVSFWYTMRRPYGRKGIQRLEHGWKPQLPSAIGFADCTRLISLKGEMP